MKPRTLFFIAIGLLIFGITLFAFSSPNQQSVQVFPATVHRDCAPWDGAAFTVSIPMSDGTTVDISIWQSPDIKLPSTFSFPDETGQVGNALLLLQVDIPEPLTGKVFFQRVEQGIPVEGRFNFTSERGGQYNGKFIAEWGSQTVHCG